MEAEIAKNLGMAIIVRQCSHLIERITMRNKFMKVKEPDGTPYTIFTIHIVAIFEPMKQIMLDGNFGTGHGWLRLDDESFARVLKAVDGE